MLARKRLLVTGVLTRKSIAFAVAREAQLSGAEVVLTGFGRTRRMTERAAARLPEPPEVLELDVNSESDLPGWRATSSSAGVASTASCTRSPSRRRMRSGATSWRPRSESAMEAFRTSAYSLPGTGRAISLR